MFLETVVGLLLCSGICLGEQGETVQLHLNPSGFAAMEFGEIVKPVLNSLQKANWRKLHGNAIFD
jgi:hypothetical protein